MYRIGIDGGGTRTRMVVIESGEERFRTQTGGINYNSFSEQDIRNALTEGVECIQQQDFGVGDCEYIGIGAAGVSNPKAAPFLKSVLHDCGFTCPVTVVGDQEAALAGAAGAGPGILLIAGTGSVCMAQDDRGNRYRAGGYGHIIEDEGSAYAVGRDILAAIVKAEDGRGPHTALKDAVYSKLGVSTIPELIAYIYDTGRTKRDIAALAVCLTEEMIKFDEISAKIAGKTAQEMVYLVMAVLTRLPGQEIPLFLEGGLILKNREINRLFREELEERKLPVYIAEKAHDAAYGAAIIPFVIN